VWRKQPCQDLTLSLAGLHKICSLIRYGKNMSIYDIARLAGVSITTVSRVLNKRRVREEVKQKILGIIAQYNYRPDPLAQCLARRKNGKTRYALSS